MCCPGRIIEKQVRICTTASKKALPQENAKSTTLCNDCLQINFVKNTVDFHNLHDLVQAGADPAAGTSAEMPASEFMYQVEWQRCSTAARGTQRGSILTHGHGSLLEAAPRTGRGLRCLIQGEGAPAAMRALEAMQRALAVDKVSKVTLAGV